ncbi:YqiA/YcfP family alpha/beta fold hydrolase [Roseateles sp. BYS180W]|uniref:YqiA/YcfP family alpha/beta fold hydrolase n=1 Tax=Roseateles rivi TaxID=3299028 RepID=A0ABW7FWE1_9BURK
MTRCTHLLYLHGFRSSPLSAKAQQMASWVRTHRPDLVWCCPQLPPSPRDAMALVQRLTQDWPEHGVAVMGSSLGGYYATHVAQQRPCRAVLINPAVNPARDLAAYIGEQRCWQDPEQRLYFRAEYIDELLALHAGALQRPQQLLALIAQGDELLDWREMRARYQDCVLHVLPGGDHALSDFAHHLPLVTEFLQL